MLYARNILNESAADFLFLDLFSVLKDKWNASPRYR